MNALEKYLTAEELEVINKKPGLLVDILRHHLTHPLYKAANFAWQRTQIQQIVKGAEKYPEPLNPASWTAKQLVEHALQENVDQVHYLVSLGEKVEELESKLQKETENTKYWRDKYLKANAGLVEIEQIYEDSQPCPSTGEVMYEAEDVIEMMFQVTQNKI